MDADLAPRLAAMDPARVTSAARTVATRVATDQVAAHAAKTRKCRTVEVRPGVDGLTEWFASLPTATSAAAWSAVENLAGQYRAMDGSLTLSEARADAFGDLLLRNVDVTAKVTLGIPVVTGVPLVEPGQVERFRYDWDDDDTIVDHDTGELVRFGDLSAESREELSWIEMGPEPDGDVATVVSPVTTGYAVSGTHLPGLGWVEAATVAGLLKTLPLDVARAVLDADTGTLASHTTSAYRPPAAMREFVTTRDGTCRMWGCARRAEHVDLDHTRPWPTGPTGPTGPTTPANLAGLCRRHHRLKQTGRWRYTMTDDGTVTWTSTTGRTRTTEPQHRLE